jgi:PAS domain-containing protein
MRDQHRPKQDLINEVAALRKQVADLKDSMTERRRVEDALRYSEQQLRALVDGCPVGLCLFRQDGTPLVGNRPFARLLGYTSPAELQRVGGVLGIFTSREEQGRVFDLVRQGQERVSGVILRRHDGTRQAFGVMGAISIEPPAVVLVVLEHQPQPRSAPPFAALSAAWTGSVMSG